ncbi:UNVERIFIED_CONTAM: hypothetical protein GTU68_017261 [Idotea baltica]|nr:hypothetical protein [Idotea baltica]
MIRGIVKVSSNNIDDKVLMKSDGLPTYHLANVVDDHLMKISHVIRGEEWLPSAPLHVLLYQYLGWEDTMPQFAHLPLLLKPDGNGKLSKRDADKHGYPVFPMDWKEQGYLPEAITNFLAMLGWNPGTEQELFSLDELIENFSIERINKSGAKFDIEKGKWFNQQYLKNIPNEQLAVGFLALLKENDVACTEEKAVAICGLMKERVTFPQEIWENAQFFFFQPEEYDPKVVKQKWNDEVRVVLKEYKKALKSMNTLSAESALQTLKEILEEQGVGLGKVMQMLRVVITGLPGGPDLMEIMALLGTEEVSQRIDHALNNIS